MTQVESQRSYDPFADFQRGDVSPLIVLYQVEHGRWSDPGTGVARLPTGRSGDVAGGLLLADPDTGALHLTEQGRHLLATTKDYDAGGPDDALFD